MKVTVCELPNDQDVLQESWHRLVEHINDENSEWVLLPEMPFYHWLPHSRDVDPGRWEAAVKAHETWIERFLELGDIWIAGTRPVVRNGKNLNEGFIWNRSGGIRPVHSKYHLPDEPGFWEASWYDRGEGDFQVIDTSKGNVGFLICTELWFLTHARKYSHREIQLLLCPRATPSSSAQKWIAGGQTAAVVSGAWCLSSNLSGTTEAGGDYAGRGWIIEPEEGAVVGLTSPEQPFLTANIDLDIADRAKKTYPRYVSD